jgi:mannose-6-phosphate isomerase-like protein (cupin superfamily)
LREVATVRLSKPILLVTVLALIPLLAGCLTRRQQALVERRPHNRVFTPEEAEIPEGQSYSFTHFDQGGSQDVMVLKLAPEAKLTRRYHADHDLTLIMSVGSAIVQVEETRYFVEQGAAVVLPRMTAYAVMPHRTEEPITAVMVYSPPYDPEDVHLE